MFDKDVGQLLYYRSLNRARHRKVGRLMHLCEANPRQPATANAQYAIGRAYASLAIARLDRGRPDVTLARMAVSHLRAAVRRKSLGDHRREHAEHALGQLPGTMRRTRGAVRGVHSARA